MIEFLVTNWQMRWGIFRLGICRCYRNSRLGFSVSVWTVGNLGQTAEANNAIRVNTNLTTNKGQVILMGDRDMETVSCDAYKLYK